MTAVVDRPPAAAPPPHNLEAEEALLGSMMLSGESVRFALDALSAADFYKPAHRVIFVAAAALHARETPVDPVTLGDALARDGEALEQVGGRGALLRIQAGTPASMHAPHYAQIVGELAAARRAWRFADDLKTAAREVDDEAIARLARDAEDRLSSPATAIEPAEDVARLIVETEEVERRWVIDSVLAAGECMLLTGEPGQGKTTLMRQLQVQVAMGRHPFQRTDVEPRTTLYVDLQDPRAQVASEFRRFLEGPARSYERGSGRLLVKRRQQGLDLTTARDARWLDALVAHHRPDLLLLGPIYRCYRGSEGAGKSSEEAADAVADVFARLMTRYDLALILEGHSPHDAAKMDYRPRGSHLWMDWPTFGFGLAPIKRRAKPEDGDEGAPEKSVTGKALPPRYRLVSWRGPRDRGRPWPDHLLAAGFAAGGWPWVPPDNDPSTVIVASEQEEIF